MSDHRPDPDALLAKVQEDEARQERGKLKIFFGAAPGVGKTYSMLEARARSPRKAPTCSSATSSLTCGPRRTH